MNVPEGLHLTVTPALELCICDAQDLEWITFREGGVGDPVEWPKNIVTATCARLGVREAIDEYGHELTVEDFITSFFDDIDFLR